VSESKGTFAKIAEWFDSRLGLSYEFLRPVPQYAINPFYWLGALAVVAFVIQGVTGTIMMLYYTPSPTQAYQSTLYIFSTVNYGRFLETVHLYTAYAMIMLAFMHLMRGYFVSVHKKPREVMWLVGMGMGIVTLGFGFTGYLLPWTVVSKSATDVGLGMINALPPQVASSLTFLIVGAGSDASELLRFYNLHVVVLPAVLLGLLVVKMFMLEAHGVAEPTGGEGPASMRRLVPIFPGVTLYLLELTAMFGVGMMVISAIFPLSLPPEYTPAAAAQAVAQPDWYFLWIYQILKLSIFEGQGLTAALGFVTVVMLVLIFLPVLDRGEERRLSRRPIYVTLGAILVAELIVLAYWGDVTPGQVIPLEQGILFLGGTALIISLLSGIVYRILFLRRRTTALPSQPSTRSAQFWSGGLFALLAGLGALSIGGSINSAVALILSGMSLATVLSFAAWLGVLCLVLLASTFMLYRMDFALGMVKRRVKVLETGWDDGN
jgi:quinol-cytochrome oxidoreductase complex cytochrome b subunit